MPDDLIRLARERLGRGDALPAIALFAEAYEAAVTAGDRGAQASALLGWAQAEFAAARLASAARHAEAAHGLLSELGLPEADRAADLVAQIAHYQHPATG